MRGGLPSPFINHRNFTCRGKELWSEREEHRILGDIYQCEALISRTPQVASDQIIRQLTACRVSVMYFLRSLFYSSQGLNKRKRGDKWKSILLQELPKFNIQVKPLGSKINSNALCIVMIKKSVYKRQYIIYWETQHDRFRATTDLSEKRASNQTAATAFDDRLVYWSTQMPDAKSAYKAPLWALLKAILEESSKIEAL